MIYAAALEGLIYWMIKRSYQTKEYLSGYATNVDHHNSWVERVVVTRTYTDSKGNTKTRTEVRHVYHPDQWFVYYNTGRVHNISSSKFFAISSRWGTIPIPIFPRHINCVSGGGGESYLWDRNNDTAFTTTYTGRYTNYILNSNSIFKSNQVTSLQVKQWGLIPYPTGCTGQDFSLGDEIDCILVSAALKDLQVPFSWTRPINLFNATFGMSKQIHVFVLLYPSENGLQTAVHQREYWRGGNKNEFTICLGIEPTEDKQWKVSWCEAFSWCDIPQMESAMESWFLEHKILDFEQLSQWLSENVSLWKRKEFKDFEYLKSRIPAGRSALIGFITVALCLVQIYLTMVYLPALTQ